MSDQLFELEEQGWEALSSPNPIAFCEQWLAQEATIIVPGMVIDRQTFLRALQAEQPWDSHDIENARAFPLTDDSAAMIYHVRARRGDKEFVGHLISVYVKRNDRWQLVLHQQTPTPPA